MGTMPGHPFINFVLEYTRGMSTGINTMAKAEEVVRYAAQIIRQHVPDPSYRIFLFGSRAEGNFRINSDIDIGIEGPAPLPRETITDIAEELEDAPTLYSIDVVDFARVPAKFRAVASKRITL